MFLRFNTVQLWYYDCYGYQPIEKKCEFIESHLLPFKPVLNYSNMIEFNAHIDQNDRRYFSDSSQLLKYIRHQFIPIFNLSNGYTFKICFDSDRNSAANTIASILQMDKMVLVSYVYGFFENFFRGYSGPQITNMNHDPFIIKICYI